MTIHVAKRVQTLQYLEVSWAMKYAAANEIDEFVGSRRHDDSRCKACPDATVSGS